MKYVVAILVVAIVALVALFVLVPEQETPPVPEPPCEELVWMRDSPQARCVEYWKQRNLEENR